MVLMLAPLTGLWLAGLTPSPTPVPPRWPALLPGAVLVAIGFQVTHGLVVYLLGPKLETSMSLYGALGVLATLLFFMWVIGRIVVTAPILNSALNDELNRRHDGDESEPVLSDTTLRRVSSAYIRSWMTSRPAFASSVYWPQTRIPRGSRLRLPEAPAAPANPRNAAVENPRCRRDRQFPA